MARKIKILEICPFSAGICGVWARAASESREFQKEGFEVRVFSSNIIKGTHNSASCEEDIEGIKIKRFPSKNSIMSENVYSFNFEKDLKKYNPDIVITHLLHPHSFKALKLCKKLKIPCYLVTHAPFNVARGFTLNLITKIYNSLKVKHNLKDFTGIIAITQWEIPYLIKLGVKREKITYIPNGLPEEFFTQKISKPSNLRDVLFLGRIAPVKNLECFLRAAKNIPRVNFSMVGVSEKEYLEKLKIIMEKENIPNVAILQPVTDLKRKIELFDKYRIFVLPSNREAMPQVLIEAMARGKLIIASKTDGAKEIVENNKTGILFELGDYKNLAKLIQQNIKGNKKIQNNAKKESTKYKWKNLIKIYLNLFNKK